MNERKRQMKDNEPITRTERVCAGIAILWALCGATLAGMLVGGCKSIEVTRRGPSLATLTDTNGVARVAIDPQGKPILLDGGWSVDYFQHWNWQKFDALHATAGEGVELSLNGYESGADSNLVALVKTSFDGAALLAAKVGAAIATSGGSVAADGAKSAISAAVQKFIKRGGSAANATVTCKDGNCTISDGSVTETCEKCFE